ncbi:MAG TPA: thioredoxin domain-containing protein [Vicinamibacterales bacterium]|nr:thioredoxin domain-containing protein [Vicinamibacterales bacterium]
MANRLAAERSPYLLQHQDNPVDWYPWGEAAFARARELDRPIFLSIGYSTCHWCHVMAHESFEDESIAAVLNRDYVPVKLDREERPDIDRVYMMFVQATTGAGGWPMSVWLTPDLRPLFGGTYFPPSTRWGRPGFIDVLTEIASAWRTRRETLVESAQTILDRLTEATGADGAAPDRSPVAGLEAVTEGIASFAHGFDAQHGGFGGAPKFPRPSELLFLLQAHALTGDTGARHMALETLQAMSEGGIRDHIGGGFHRYSVDGEWRVPHFEKMLYDQAQLVLAYLEAAQAAADPYFAAVAEDTLDYVRRDLTGEDGAFLSAEDADSATAAGEKREGAFYVWSADEIDALTGADADIVRRRFGIEEAGNAPADPQGEFRGQNILYVSQPIEDIAARSGRPADDVIAVLARARQVLFEARSGRPRPHRDDKVIAAWNGLMIAAFARAGRVLVESPSRADWIEAATRAAASVRAQLWQADRRRLLRCYRDGDAGIDAFAEDYACLVWGLTELVEATGDGQWLDWAVDLTRVQTDLFFDPTDGGWFSTTGEDPSVLLRLKEDYDGAEPSAASVTVRNLLTLGRLLGDADLVARAGRTLERYGTGIGRVTRVMPMMVSNVVRWHAGSVEIVLAGSDAGRFQALEAVVAKRYQPAAVHVPIRSDATRATLGRLPWVQAMTPPDGRAAAFVCRDLACQAPITEAETLDRALADAAAPRRIL